MLWNSLARSSATESSVASLREDAPMPDWAWWLIVSVVLLIGEVVVFTGFILGPLAIAGAAAAIVAVAGGSIELQLAVFALGGIACLLVLRPLARRHLDMPQETRTNAAALVGQRAVVLRAMDIDTPGLVRLANEDWTAEPAAGVVAIDEGARVVVKEIKGATAVVEPAEGES